MNLKYRLKGEEEMKSAIDYLTRKLNSLDRTIERLNAQEEQLNAELVETVANKLHVIQTSDDIIAALNKLRFDNDLPTSLEGSEQ